jgi:type VI protein secretion system component VasK
MFRKIAVIVLVVCMSVASSWWFYLGLEAGEGTPVNTLVRKVVILAALGALIAAAVASITRVDDRPHGTK